MKFFITWIDMISYCIKHNNKKGNMDKALISQEMPHILHAKMGLAFK